MAEDTIYKFKHKTVRRFGTAQYEFHNFEIFITGDAAREEFLEVIGRLPAREKVNIVEINVEAAAAAEKSLAESANIAGGGGAVRGAMTAGDIQTSKDAGLAAQQYPQVTNLAAAQQPAKPVGFGGLSINGK